MRSAVRVGLLVLLAAPALVAPAPATAEVVRVRVTEIAGGRAYLAPGSDAGLRPGQVVRLGGRALRVVEVTRTSAVVELDGAPLAVGASGQATVDAAGAGPATKVLAPVHPADAWRAQWPILARPASAQVVRSVALGAVAAPGRLHAAFALHGLAVVSGEDPAGEVAARAVVSYQLLPARPLAFDLDGAVRIGLGDEVDLARAPVRVRAAQLRYGDHDAPTLALGRLRYAAAMLGPLDGARAAVTVGPVTLAAFGGLSPDPTRDRPDPDDVHVGGEVVLDLARARWRPMLAVTASGSAWQGQLDERRLSLTAAAGQGGLAIDGWAELSAFAADNPWGAAALELTGAGAGARWRGRGGHASAGAVLTRPERSLRLEALLGREWQCAQVIDPAASAAEACRGDDLQASGHVAAGRRFGDRALIEAGATLGTSHGVRRFVDASGFARAELGALPAGLRLEVGGSGGRTSFVDWGGVMIGVGAVVGPRGRLELSGRYRPELWSYVASAGTDRFLQHTVELGARARLDAQADVALDVAGSTGRDRDVMTVLASWLWRPRP